MDENYIKGFCESNKYQAYKFIEKSTGISKAPSKKDFRTTFTLQPNPAASYTTLRIENPSSDKAMIRIYDLIGREVYKLDAADISDKKNEVVLNTEGLNKGIYIVNVVHGDVEQGLKLEVNE